MGMPWFVRVSASAASRHVLFVASCVGGLWPSAGDVDAAHPAVAMPLELQRLQALCRQPGRRLDVRGRLPDGGNIHAKGTLTERA
jgi:hypothetical protein